MSLPITITYKASIDKMGKNELLQDPSAGVNIASLANLLFTNNMVDDKKQREITEKFN